MNPPTFKYALPTNWSAKPTIICALIGLFGVGGLVGMAKYYQRENALRPTNRSPGSQDLPAEKPYEPLPKSPAPGKCHKVEVSTDDEGTAIRLMKLIAGYPGEAQSRREGNKVVVEYSGAVAADREACASRLAEFRTNNGDRITGWIESTEGR